MTAQAAGDSSMEAMNEIVSEFLVESRENLDQLDQDLVALEREPGNHELLSSIFRAVHTINGTCGFLAFGTLGSVTQVGQNLLSRLRDGEMALTPQLTTLLLEMVDAARSLLTSIERSGGEGDGDHSALMGRLQAVLDGADAHSAITKTTAIPETTAIPQTSGRLVGNECEVPGAGSTATSQSTPTDGAAAPELGGTAQEQVSRRLMADGLRDNSIRVDVDLLDGLMNLVGELVLTRNQLLRLLQRTATCQDTGLERSARQLNSITSELQEGVMKTRMQPIDHVWSKLPRVVGNLCVSLGKSVRVEMEGRDTQLDKAILEAVTDPLTHLVRNCVDGVEQASVRVAAGKPAEGRLMLRAFHQDGQVIVEITDDGAGIDTAKLRARAVAHGMLTPEAAGRLSEQEALHLIFQPGLSTTTAVTNLSGRGVGMDVVRTNVEQIGGVVEISSILGQGTTVRVRIPLTLAIIPVLMVSAAGSSYAIPQVNLTELVRLEPEETLTRIESVQGIPVCRLRDGLLPLVDLRELLGLPAADPVTTYIAVLQSDGRAFGLVVDNIESPEEIVVKPLGPQLRGIALYAGATITADGGIALILDVNALGREAGMVRTVGDLPASVVPTTDDAEVEGSALLVLRLTDGRRVALPLSAVDRLEQFPLDRLERVGGHEVVQYRGGIVPLVRLDHVLQSRGEQADADPVSVVLCQHRGQPVGFVVAGIHDIVESDLAVRAHLDAGGDHGSVVIDGYVTELLDVERAVSTIAPGLLAPVVVG